MKSSEDRYYTCCTKVEFSSFLTRFKWIPSF